MLHNISWLACSQVFRLITGFLVGTWLTRSLGPGQNGLLGTAMVIGALASNLAELGLRQILMKEFATNKRDAPILLGTAFRMMLIAGIVLAALAVGAAWLWGGRELALIGLILYAPLPLNACVVILSLWDGSNESHRTGRSAIVSMTIAHSARIACILSGADLLWAAATIPLESVITAVTTSQWAIRRGFGKALLQWSWPTARRLLSESLPNIAAHVGTLLLLRVDQLMLFKLRGENEAGIYAAATRLSEVVYAAGPVIIMGFMSTLAVTSKTDPERYRRLAGALFTFITLLAYGAAIFWFFGGEWVVSLLYGPAFQGVSEILLIHMLAALPYMHGELRGALLVIEKKTIWSTRCALFGLLVNISLNLWLIPTHGALGAAMSTAVAYVFVWFISSLLLPALRHIGALQAASLLAPWSWRTQLTHLRAATKVGAHSNPVCPVPSC
jgi:polysaccharide transporter, PST family